MQRELILLQREVIEGLYLVAIIATCEPGQLRSRWFPCLDVQASGMLLSALIRVRLSTRSSALRWNSIEALTWVMVNVELELGEISSRGCPVACV